MAFAVILVLVVCATGYPQSRCGGGLNLTVGCSGIGFGDSDRINGLRFNWRDGDLDVINGVNITFWRPKRRVRGTINGLALGLAPAAGRLHGIALGLAVFWPGCRKARCTGSMWVAWPW
jgi:hypothetical protein